MKTGLALIGVVAILAGSGPTKAQETELPAGSTLKSVTDSVGEDSTVTDAIIIGQKKEGEPFSISVGGGDIHIVSIPYTGGACTLPPYFQIQSGAYTFNWCANRRTVNGISYEVQKDMYESSGGAPVLKKKWLLDCQNPTDFQSLPDPVKALCP